MKNFQIGDKVQVSCNDVEFTGIIASELIKARVTYSDKKNHDVYLIELPRHFEVVGLLDTRVLPINVKFITKLP